MATEPDGISNEEECRVAFEAVMDVAMEHCKTEDDVKSSLSRVLGIEPDADCEAALREGLDESTCTDFAGIRQWVMCRTHRIMDGSNMGFGQAMEQAWAEAEEQCSTAGHEI